MPSPPPPPPPPGLTIRSATEADAPLILAFIRELADFEKLSHEVVATERRIRETLFGTARSTVEVLIAELVGEPAGFALFFQNYSTFLARPGIYLEDLYVRPEMRGRGVGRALLTRVAQLATERGCGRLEWAVLDWNQRAIDFYRSLGTRPMDDWTVYRLTGEALERLGRA